MRSYGNLIITIPTVLVIALSGCSAQPGSDANSISTPPPAKNAAPTPPPAVPQTPVSTVKEIATAAVTPALPANHVVEMVPAPASGPTPVSAPTRVTVVPAPVSVPTPTYEPPQKAEKLADVPRKTPPTIAPPSVQKPIVIQEPIVTPEKSAAVTPKSPLIKPVTKSDAPSDNKTLAMLEKKAPIATPAPLPETNKEPVIEPVSAVTETEPEIAINFEAMPIKIQKWILDYEVIPNTNRLKCTLRSQAQNMDDGEGGTPIFLLFDQNSLQVVTKSNIDMEYADDGLQIDLQPQRPIDRLQKETTAIFEKNWTALIQEMLHGQQAVLTFGFWPTWPMSRTYSVSFDLSHFPRAWRALESCKQKS